MVDTDWLEQDDPPRSPQRRRIVGLVALAAVPWLLVVGLLVGPRLTDDPAQGEAATSAPPAEDAGSKATDDRGAAGAEAAHAGAADGAGAADAGAADGAEPADDGGAQPTSPEETPTDGPLGGTVEVVPSQRDLAGPAGGWRVVAGAEEAASLGLVVARSALTSLDPVLSIDGVSQPDDGTYAEHLIVEAVERTGPTAATVTVLAVVLREGADLAPEVRRLAVPITLDADGPHPAGTPWELPAPSLEPRPQQLTPVDDPDRQLQALEALDEAGLDGLELTELHSAEGGPTAAEVRGPDGEQHRVWLRHHLDGFVVAGIPLPDERFDALAGDQAGTRGGATP